MIDVKPPPRFGPPELEQEVMERMRCLVTNEEEVWRLLEYLEVLEEQSVEGMREEVVARVEGGRVEAKDIPKLLGKVAGVGRTGQVGPQHGEPLVKLSIYATATIRENFTKNQNKFFPPQIMYFLNMAFIFTVRFSVQSPIIVEMRWSCSGNEPVWPESVRIVSAEGVRIVQIA